MYKQHWSLLFVCCLLAVLALASCGGGGGDDGSTSSTNDSGYNIINPGNQNQNNNDSGNVVYDGRTKPGGTDSGTTDNSTTGQDSLPLDFGANIITVPTNTINTGQLVIKKLIDGRKVITVSTNIDYSFLNYPSTAGAQLKKPVQTGYSITADLVKRPTSSLSTSANTKAPETKIDFNLKAPYFGMVNEASSPTALLDREIAKSKADGRFHHQYNTSNSNRKSSAISLYDTRVFANICRNNLMPPIVWQDTSQSQGDNQPVAYPNVFYWQQARIVGVGAHCIIFLSREYNNGYPDTIRYTQARINRFIQEFDTKIYPTSQNILAPVKSFNETNIFFEPQLPSGRDRLYREDFENNKLKKELQYLESPTQENTYEQEQKIPIFIFKPSASTSGAAGIYYPSFSPNTSAECDPTVAPKDYVPPQVNYDRSNASTLYIDGSDVVPQNSDDWTGVFAVVSHEFQHKLFSEYWDKDQQDPRWWNEALSQLNIYLNGYTLKAGNTTPILLSQVNSYLTNLSTVSPVVSYEYTNDATNETFAAYGARFMLALYLNEHFPAGWINRMYTKGMTDPIPDIEDALYKAQVDEARKQGVAEKNVTKEKFETIYHRFLLALLIDGLKVKEYSSLDDPRFRFATFDINGATGINKTNFPTPQTISWVPITRFPNESQGYPIGTIQRMFVPWTADFCLFENGQGNDLILGYTATSNIKNFVLPLRSSLHLTGRFFFSNSSQVLVTGGDLANELFVGDRIGLRADGDDAREVVEVDANTGTITLKSQFTVDPAFANTFLNGISGDYIYRFTPSGETYYSHTDILSIP